jgi:biopolymer transport protein ExbB
MKIDQPHEDGVNFQRTGATETLTFYVREQTANLELADASGELQTFPVSTPLTPGSWHHFAAIVTADRVVIYLDGAEAESFSVIVPGLEGDITIGADAYGARGLIGAIDQLSVYKSPRSAEAIKFDVLMQGQASPLLVYGEDLSPESEDGGESHVLSTMQHVSLDGWIIIGILAVMLVISFLVMAAKALVLIKNHKENRNFEDEFMKLKTAELEALNHEDTEDDEAVNASPLLASLTGGHERFTGSSVYRLYHVGVEELHHRFAKSVGADVAEAVVSEKGMDSIRAAMESCLIRETQKLNSLMVLLTISISGGPFLGLLGTVIGVMATFGEIAASGEVNVNAIAPGIAAALATTVAGLVVAIPCLFGYNYLNSRIKLITADMYIFVDEFTAKLSERYSD